MRINLLAITILLLMTSCAPMPGNTLFTGLTHETKLEDVEVIVTISAYETQLYCTQYAPWYMVALNCVTNACFIPACAIMQFDDTGGVKKCYVYSWIDVDFLIEHETRHCQGYKDLLY
jgi:hypothetical protein